MRRVERLMLGTPTVLRTISAVRVVARRDNRVVQDWMVQFAPGLRYGNPMLECTFSPAKKAILTASAPAAEADAAGSPAEAETAAGVKAADSGAPAEAAAGGASEAGEEPRVDEQEHIQLHFTDGLSHTMNLALYRQSHQVMQRIIELDIEKGLSSG
mmetsp:Transcript_151336/g.267103  ORF Transcript_151336/g.267103 Transcript_151336/m.267103 type:complete len:157 (-) Transcript_151336:41-511(-)